MSGTTSAAAPAAEHRVGRGFIGLYALAYLSTALLFVAPLLVTLALKVNALVGIERAPANLSLVTGVGALVAMVANPICGGLSDRTTSRFGRRRPGSRPFRRRDRRSSTVVACRTGTWSGRSARRRSGWRPSPRAHRPP